MPDENMGKYELYDEGPQALWEKGTKEIPHKYIRPHYQPGITDLQHPVPLIDLSKLLHVSSKHAAQAADDAADSARNDALKELRSACQSWGLFILINHGFPQSLMSDMMKVVRQFFEVPVEVKMRYFDSKPGSNKVRYGLTFTGSYDWRDYLVHPWLTDMDLDCAWPELPPHYREIGTEYSKNIRALSLKLLALLSESLGLKESFLIDTFKDHSQKMMVNRYPPCPQPHLVFGVSAHTDPNGISILQQDDVGGLEVFKDGCWHAVTPLPNSFVVNLGDALQIISNGRYKSVEHRALVNSEKHRYSIATFCGPSIEAMIVPAAELMQQEESAHAEYGEVLYGGYLTQFYSEGLKGKHYINSLKIEKKI